MLSHVYNLAWLHQTAEFELNVRQFDTIVDFANELTAGTIQYSWTQFNSMAQLDTLTEHES